MAKQVRTLEERLRIIDEVDKNPSMKRIDIARRLGLRPSTLNSILSKRDGIREQASRLRTSAMRRKTCKESLYSELEEILFSWYREARASNIPVNGNVLREKALQIAASKGLDSFCASNGWISRFKERHGLVFERLSGDGVGGGTLTDTNAADVWFQKLPELVQGYEDRNIYTSGETGLYFNSPPTESWTVEVEGPGLSRSCVFKGETSRGSKERLTVMLCTNKDGSDKRVPLVVGRSPRPLQCYEDPSNLPATYHANQKGCMTNEIFEGFLHDFDAEVGREQDRKVVLFVGSCSVSSSDVSSLENVKVIFYPQDCTRAVQPLDTGVIKCFKQAYRKSLERRALMEEAGKSIDLKIDVVEALSIIVDSWEVVTRSTILDSFVKCGYLRTTEDRLSLRATAATATKMEHDEEWLRSARGNTNNVTSPEQDAKMTNLEGAPIYVESENANSKQVDGGQEQIRQICSTKRGPKSKKPKLESTSSPSFAEALSAFGTVKAFLCCQVISEKDKENIAHVEDLLLSFKSKSSA